ncbi:MAG: amylo-alpha-1,6-glucosidase [Planctomycetota bacterium]
MPPMPKPSNQPPRAEHSSHALRPGDGRDPLRTEWLLTNALGGFAMGTALGVPTRRYHALLIAAMNPPVDRVLALADVDCRLTLSLPDAAPDARAVHRSIGPFHFLSAPDRVIADPALVEFTAGPSSCLWVYRLPGVDALPEVTLTRELHLFEGRNACRVRYRIDTNGVPWSLALRPLVPLRDMHRLGDHAGKPPRARVNHDVPDPKHASVLIAGENHGLFLDGRIDTGDLGWRDEPAVWRGVEYLWERTRGLTDNEDIHAPGLFEASGRAEATVDLTASIDAMPLPGAEDDARARSARLASIASAAIERAQATDPLHTGRLARLACAADAYVVRRGTAHDAKPGVSSLAGYPWFADWGRDTMICLPGLFLATGRRDEAFRTLVTFARARRRGLIPNHFDDYAGPAHYNTVDAPLWFVHACCQYLKETGDRPGFAAELLPACDEVVLAYRHGTDHNIHADPADGLISAGDPETQLTWMDARRDGVTFTPRWGKAVEINALWHNALAGLAEAVRPDTPAFAVDLESHARRVADSFRRVFLGGPLGGLVDHLTPTGEDGAWEASLQLRPNQVFAVSLPHSALTPEDQRRVIDLVADRLLTPVGLRTLDADDPAYRPRFEGDMFKRDGAYHNGTVWPWLIGPYAEGVLRAHAFSDASRERARAAIIPLIDSMDRDLLGQIAEVYDADEPRRADGCLAQAWSVAEPLRAYALSLRD